MLCEFVGWGWENMIAQITGKLVELNSNTAVVQIGQICYEILLPGYLVSVLSNRIGQEITLCTMEYYEGTVGGGNLIPRIVGFLNAGEKDFFCEVHQCERDRHTKGVEISDDSNCNYRFSYRSWRRKNINHPAIGR